MEKKAKKKNFKAFERVAQISGQCRTIPSYTKGKKQNSDSFSQAGHDSVNISLNLASLIHSDTVDSVPAVHMKNVEHRSVEK